MADFKRYMTDMSHDELMEACRRIRHVALDMDGTIYLGSQLFPFTKPFFAISCRKWHQIFFSH